MTWSALGLLLAVSLAAPDPAPELGVDGPVLAPIRHEKFFRGERELFGYNPRFVPNAVTFDPDNRPYIRFGVKQDGHQNTYANDWATREGYVQTLDDDGAWIRLGFVDAIQQAFPDWDGKFLSGTFAEERLAFDDRGDAYMVVNASRSNLKRIFLLHSRDRARTWRVHPLPPGWARLEIPDGHNDTSRPPVVLHYADWKGSPLLLFVPERGADGTLTVPAGVLVEATSNVRPSPMHSGLGNTTVTVGDKTYIGYLSMDAVEGRPGTPQYVVSYDRTTGTMSAPVLLGVNGRGQPDEHNGPALTVDSRGMLHAVLGSHHDPFEYAHSLRPLDASEWTEPVAFGQPNDPPKGSYTYPSLICDADDTLHVVGRYAGEGYRFALDYLRKPAGGEWEDRGHLVFPFRAFYSCWYHRLALDRRGRLFLNYIYYGNQYGDEHNPEGDTSGDEIAAYREKWPHEEVYKREGSRLPHGDWVGVNPHDPAMLVSDDGGDTWRLAVTEDFRP